MQHDGRDEILAGHTQLKTIASSSFRFLSGEKMMTCLTQHVWEAVRRGTAVEEFRVELRCRECGCRKFVEVWTQSDAHQDLFRKLRQQRLENLVRGDQPTANPICL